MESLINSQIGLRMAVSLARTTPPRMGTGIARLAARWITSRPDSELVRAIRANQWVVAGGKRTREVLDRDVLAVFQHSARSVYELYHFIQDPGRAGKLFTIEASFQEILDRPKFDHQGIIVAGLHMSGFDLALQWTCTYWIDPLGLTIPNPEGGRGMEFKTRKRTGINLVPGSKNGLKEAIRYLDQGGMVVTGIDRPLADAQRKPLFFGQPASLPTHHIFLALKARVPLRLVVSKLETDGSYHLRASPPIEMDPYPRRGEALLRNAEKVLSVAEGFIREAPQQWLVSLPVWPEVVDQVPG